MSSPSAPMEPPVKPPANRAMHQLRLFFIALQFYTRLPIPNWVGFESAWLAQASRYFPAVGLVVGGMAALVYAAAAWLWPQPVAVLLSMAASIYITGAFHEDGFADTCDGIGGGSSRERVLEIMKDSRIGSYGAVGVGLLLALKAATLIAMPVHTVVIALIVGHPLSRLAALLLVWRLEYVKIEGKTQALARHLGTKELGIAMGTAAAIAVPALATGWLSLSMLFGGIVSILVVAIGMGRMFVRRIGGYTGDCLGAVQQVSELVFYLAVLALIG